ncbi:nucleoside kinase [Vallitalea guaymasensis]|uniref:Nucleoside kinase n=1 Tax=Vallitalea guaymasensis TaxID=1185412 RepID=A0A8J8M6Y5_9FIRM|nr:nucleoside kinase [Vallitalea guaymasensis]QUH27522.1 nucleoside kinase [Vallitalea guaymasensis]
MRNLVEIILPDGRKRHVEKGISLLELSKKYQKDFKAPIVLALTNNKLKELRSHVNEDCKLEFLDLTSRDGYRTYLRSVSFLMIKSIYDILGRGPSTKVIIHHSLSRGFYCELKGHEVTEEFLNEVKNRMDELVKKDVPFLKRTVSLNKAIKTFDENFMEDKVRLFNYRRVSNVNLYKIEDFEDYFYGYMVPSTGYLNNYDLLKYEDGFILQFQSRNKPTDIAPFHNQQKLFKTLKESSDWGEIMDVETVGALNNKISEGKINELILIAEALQEKKIAAIADTIMKDIDNKKIIFIAGPSSSGKTTFAHRLSIQLRANGLKPHPISVDNYFVNREDTPRDKNGNYDFECLEALDIKQFNTDMMNLLNGQPVEMPEFNFKVGKREYNGRVLQLEKNDLLVVEGIHCLNDKLSVGIPRDNMFKIYISALTQLNIDNHNRIPTTDARLLRRIIRDNTYRGTNAEKTIAMWPSVRKGEELYIFPYQEKADVMFNSALVYELAVLKQYAEPLLFSISKDKPEYIEAKRLIKFLDYFLGVSSEKIPRNSLIREFVGGSCFR